MKEVQAFDRRYFEKLSGMDAAAAAQQMAQALAMYPGLKDLMGRARLEGTKVEGTPISTVTTTDAVRQPRAAEAAGRQRQAAGSPAAASSGMLARKMMKKKQAEGGAHSERRQEPLDVRDDHHRR